MGVRLPAAYQEVEYVQATGTQAFFTDVPIQDGLTVDSVQTFARGDNYLFGGNNGNVQICFNGTYNGRLQSSYNGFYYWTNGFDVQDNNTTKYHVVQTQRNGSQIGFLDDVQILNGTRSTTKDTSAGETAALFGQRNASDALSLFYKGKVYSCKVSKDGTLLADFVPCYRKADGEIGMYDLVLQKFYVNEGTGVFLKGNDVIDSISPLMVAWRQWIMAAASVAKKLVKLIATATSGLVSFTTNVIRPVKVICEFSPAQEGTGDPSPDNVRPISGRTGCEITHTGKNLLSPDDTGYGNYTIGPTGNHTTGGYARLSSGFIPVSKGDVLTLGTWITLHKNVGFGFAGIAIYDKDKQFVRRESKNSTWSITATIGEGEKYIRAFSQFEPESESAILTPSVWSRYKIQLERASSRTTYESYTGSTLPITFTDPTTGDPLTVYGGTVTLNEDGSADVVSDVRFRTLVGTESWATEVETGTYSMKFKLNLSDMKYGSNITNALTNYIKRRESQAEGYKAGSLCIQFGWNDHRIFVLNATKDIADVSDLATWKAYLADHPLEIVYPLTTPTTYHFDSIGQLQSFLGTNNIWHNMNGDITVEYWNKQ